MSWISFKGNDLLYVRNYKIEHILHMYYIYLYINLYHNIYLNIYQILFLKACVYFCLNEFILVYK